MKLLSAITGDRRFEEVELQMKREGKEARNMCEIVEKFEQNGREAKCIEDVKALMETLGLSAQKAMDALRVAADDRQMILRKLEAN